MAVVCVGQSPITFSILYNNKTAQRYIVLACLSCYCYSLHSIRPVAGWWLRYRSVTLLQ